MPTALIWTQQSIGAGIVNANPTASDWITFSIGLLIVILTALDLIQTLIMTRGSRSLIRTCVTGPIKGLITTTARFSKSYLRRDSMQSWIAPMMLVGLLFAWLILFVIGYAFMLHGAVGIDPSTAFREAGSSLFTLGYASSDRSQLSTIDFVAAATGPITIGLMISYLPSLYASYNRRELDVAILKAHAGEPNWGPEILARHAALESSHDHLNRMWRDWERWTADVSETHASYPALIYTRSARPLRNWVIALLAVMDAASLSLVLRPQDRQIPARIFLRQAIECLRDLAVVAHIRFDPAPTAGTPIQLPQQEFVDAYSMLASIGYNPHRTVEEAWPLFCDWRMMYESIIYELAWKIDAVPAKWSGPRRVHSEPMAPRPPQYVVSSHDGSIGFPNDAKLESYLPPKKRLG